MRPDGSLPTEGWTSVYHRRRNEPFESTAWTQDLWHVPELKNYMPFSGLPLSLLLFRPQRPAVCLGGAEFATDEAICLLLRGCLRTSAPTTATAGLQEDRSDTCLEMPGCRRARSWRSEVRRAVLPNRAGWCATASTSLWRMQVITDRRFGKNGRVVASITHYQHEGRKQPLLDSDCPSDRPREMPRCAGRCEKCPGDQHAERTLGAVAMAADARYE